MDKQIFDLMQRATYGRLVINGDNYPYIVPMNFGFDQNNIYLHTSQKSKKLALLTQNTPVVFQIDELIKIKEDKNPCEWNIQGFQLRIFGKAGIIENPDEKISALNKIVSHYTNSEDFNYDQGVVERTAVIKIAVESVQFQNK